MARQLVLVLALTGALTGVQRHIDAEAGAYRATEEVLYVESGALLKKVMVGFENVAADLYWLRTVQYFGGRRRMVTNKDYSLLEPLLRITTELDPDFRIAYTYGATFLSEPFPMGAGLPIKGIQVIEHGIENHPDYWRFYLDKGFIYFWHLKDYQKAADVFLAGSKLPGAPYWMVTTASRALTRGGERETARMLWGIQYESAETDQQRENALTHLRQLDALDDMDALDLVIEEARALLGETPLDWNLLVSRGLLTGVPLDPKGNPYVLDPMTGEVSVPLESSLGVLPTE